MNTQLAIKYRKNFFLYVFTMMGFGMMFVALFTIMFGTLLGSLIQQSKGLFIVLLFGIIIGRIIVDTLFQRNILSNNFLTSFILYAVSIVMTGITLSPIYLLSQVGYGHVIAPAFIGTSVLFISLASYGLISKKDFTSLEGVLTAGSIAFISIFVLKYIIMFFSPALASAISLGVSFLSILLSSGFILYHLATLKKFYTEHSYNTTALSKVGLLGAHLLLMEFVSIFINLVYILMRVDNSKKK